MKKANTSVVNQTYRERMHRMGRIWSLAALLMLLAVPLSICVYYSAWPPISGVLKGMLGVVPIFWTVGTIEVITIVSSAYWAFVYCPSNRPRSISIVPLMFLS